MPPTTNAHVAPAVARMPRNTNRAIVTTCASHVTDGASPWSTPSKNQSIAVPRAKPRSLPIAYRAKLIRERPAIQKNQRPPFSTRRTSATRAAVAGSGPCVGDAVALVTPVGRAVDVIGVAGDGRTVVFVSGRGGRGIVAPSVGINRPPTVRLGVAESVRADRDGCAVAVDVECVLA